VEATHKDEGGRFYVAVDERCWLGDLVLYKTATQFVIKDIPPSPISPYRRRCFGMHNFQGETQGKTAPVVCIIWVTVLGLEWDAWAGTIGGEVLEGIQRSTPGEEQQGLVIAGEGQKF